MLARLQAIALVLYFIGLSGCGPSIANVKGKVSADGKEVTGGGIVLSPLGTDGKAAGGKPGMADIGSDGTFSMDVELPSASSSRFAVRFSPPQPLPTKAFKDGVIAYNGYMPKQAEVELKPGPNAVAIEIAPGKRPLAR